MSILFCFCEIYYTLSSSWPSASLWLLYHGQTKVQSGSVFGEQVSGGIAHEFGKIQASDVHAKLELKKGKYILLSAHREENIDYRKEFLKPVYRD